MQLPLTLPLHRSRVLDRAVAGIHAVAAVALVPVTVLPLAATVTLWGVLAVSLLAFLRRPSEVALVLRADGRLELLEADGRAVTVEVHPGTTVHSWLVVLLTRSAGRIRVLAMPPDALGTDGHRQLRIWLKWLAKGGTA